MGPNHAPSDEQWRARDRLAQQLTIKARDLDKPWGPQASNRVKLCGERLSKVIWQKCRDGSDAIDRKRLWEEDTDYSWVMHMAGKRWVDLKDFAEALRVARIYK